MQGREGHENKKLKKMDRRKQALNILHLLLKLRQCPYETLLRRKPQNKSHKQAIQCNGTVN